MSISMTATGYILHAVDHLTWFFEHCSKAHNYVTSASTDLQGRTNEKQCFLHVYSVMKTHLVILQEGSPCHFK